MYLIYALLGVHNAVFNGEYAHANIGVTSGYKYIIAERLHLILQHALSRCIFFRHAPLSVTLYCPSRSSTHARKDGGGVTHTFVVSRDGGGERDHARPNAWAFARALDGRRGYGQTSPSTSARAIYCARHMYAHSSICLTRDCMYKGSRVEPQTHTQTHTHTPYKHKTTTTAYQYIENITKYNRYLVDNIQYLNSSDVFQWCRH